MLVLHLLIVSLLVFIEWDVALAAKLVQCVQFLVPELHTKWILGHPYELLCSSVLSSLDSAKRLKQHI